MDRANLRRVNQLYDEFNQLAQAVVNLDGGGRIVSMDIMGPPGEMSATVPTGYIAYPPPMVASIKTALQGRQQEINNELTSLGLTGFAISAQPLPHAAAARAPRTGVPPQR